MSSPSSDSSSPPSPTDNTGGIYSVEKIVGMRMMDGVMKYKVRWKGYDPSEDTWEPEENLLTCKSLVEEYITRRDQKAGQRRAKSSQRSQSSLSNYYEKLREEEIDKSSNRERSVDSTSRSSIPNVLKPSRDEEPGVKALEPKKKKPIAKGGKESKAKTKDVNGTPEIAKIGKEEGSQGKEGKEAKQGEKSKKDDKKSRGDNTSATKVAKPVPPKLSLIESSLFGDTLMLEAAKKHSKPKIKTPATNGTSAIQSKASGETSIPSTTTSKSTVNDQETAGDWSKKQPSIPSSSDDGRRRKDSESSTTSSTTTKLPKVGLPAIKAKDVRPPANASTSIGKEVSPDWLQLHSAVDRLDAAEVVALLDQKGPYKAKIWQLAQSGVTLLMLACQRQDNENQDLCRIIEYLVVYGSPVDFQNVDGETTLFQLCKKGSPCCVETFLKFGPRLDIRAKNGETALFAAVRNGNYFMVKSLVWRGACCSYKNRNGETVMDLVRDRLTKDPGSEEIEKVESLLTDFSKRITEVSEKFVSVLTSGQIRLTDPVFDLHWFSTVNERDDIEIRFDLNENAFTQTRAALMFITTVKIASVDSVETYTVQQGSLIRNVLLNGKKLQTIPEGPGKNVVFVMDELRDRRNKLIVKVARAYQKQEVMILQARFAEELDQTKME